MKAKIDEKGWLRIERSGEFRKQTCPFSPQENYCGDWCPLFVEIKNAVGEKGYLDIKLACGTAIHEIVSDERKETCEPPPKS